MAEEAQEVSGNPTTVDDKVIQRILFISSDILAKHIYNASPAHDQLIDLDGKGAAGNTLAKKETAEVLRRQAELFSDTMVTSPEAGRQIFGDNITEDPRDTEYTIHNIFMLYLSNDLFWFDIDKVNAENEGFIISKVVIKNESKEAYTLKANYKVRLTINFTSFDDLLADNVVVTSASTGVSGRISIMNLLYAYYKQKGGNESLRHLVNPEGIYLSQVLKMLPGKTFNQIRADLGDNEIWKTYHLTYYKHNFDMFNNDNPIFNYYENQLVVEYVAHEADGIKKIENTAIKKALTPNVNFNIFSCLSDKDFKGLKDSLEIVGIEFARLQTLLKSRDTVTAQLDQLIKYLECTPDGGESATDSQKESLTNGVEKLKNINVILSRVLIFTILNYCKIFKLTVPYDLLGVYSASNFAEVFKNSVLDLLPGGAGMVGYAAGSAAVGAIGTGATLATVGSAVFAAAAPIALLAIAGVALYAGISAWNAKKTLAREIDTSTIRKEIIKLTADIQPGNTNPDAPFTSEVEGKLLFLGKGNKDEASAMAPVNGSSRLNYNNEAAKKETEALLTNVGKISVLDEAELSKGRKAPIFFTTFGEILKFVLSLDKDKKLYMLNGGYLMDLNTAEGKASYVYFSVLPITINSLSNFLHKNIEETDRNFNYDSELFIRDIYSNLVKAVVQEGFASLESVKNATPKNLKIASSVHADGRVPASSWLKPINLLDSGQFANLKRNYIKSKNLNLLQKNFSGSLIKVYKFGTVDEVKHYNFYEDYWSGKGKRPLNTLDFQGWINTKHMMPCLLMKNISNSESIIKKKYVKFSRIDNQNLNTGNFLNSFGQLRYPYEFKGDFKPYAAFFLDIGSYLFIAPPASNLETTINMFGFGGLYIMRGSEMEYNFQVIKDGKITIPNLESKVTLDGYMISHGDSINQQANVQASKDCATLTSGEPIAKDTSFVERNEYADTAPDGELGARRMGALDAKGMGMM